MAIYSFLDEHEKVDLGMAKSHKLWVKPSPAGWFSDVIKAIHNRVSHDRRLFLISGISQDRIPQQGQNSPPCCGMLESGLCSAFGFLCPTALTRAALGGWWAVMGRAQEGIRAASPAQTAGSDTHAQSDATRPRKNPSHHGTGISYLCTHFSALYH